MVVSPSWLGIRGYMHVLEEEASNSCVAFLSLISLLPSGSYLHWEGERRDKGERREECYLSYCAAFFPLDSICLSTCHQRVWRRRGEEKREGEGRKEGKGGERGREK